MNDVQDLAELIHKHRDEDHARIVALVESLADADIAEMLNAVPSLEEAAEVLELLPVARSIRVCNQPTLLRRVALLEQVPSDLGAQLLNGMASDQRSALVRHMSSRGCRQLMPLLSDEARVEVEQQLQYPDGSAGDLMTSEFVQFAPTTTVSQAMAQLRDEARDRETIYACYVVDPQTGGLLGAVSLRDLVMANPADQVGKIMRSNPVTVGVREPRKTVIQKISKYNLLAVPALESDGRIVGFVTVDDAIDAMIEEQTDTVLRMGGVEAGALDDPYMATPWPILVKKRAAWLVLLFLGEMLTATAMGHFEGEIAKAVVLALFVPLIISSGGNSGSQATSLLIRALALGEVRLRDWARVLGRELLSGLSLGVILGAIGVLRISLWQELHWYDYGPHWLLVALTVGFSLVGIVLWGSISGAMLPFILKRLGLDPATSSAPFVATLVDVTGLIIYFGVAQIVLRGTLL